MTSEQFSEQKRARMALFIDCTYELIEEIGYNEISIRRIADRAGYHNSSIYFYFSDLDQLLALASVRYFEEYSKSLASISSLYSGDADVFYPIWECFCKFAFERPHVYKLFFFGKYGENITALLNQYYAIFPEEKREYSAVVREMYFSNTFKDRCRAILLPLIHTPWARLSTATVDLVNELSIAYFKSLLDEKCTDSALDNEELTTRFMQALHYLVDL